MSRSMLPVDTFCKDAAGVAGEVFFFFLVSEFTWFAMLAALVDWFFS